MLILVEHGTCFLFIYLFIEKSHLTYHMTIHKTIHIYNLDKSNDVVPVLIDLELEMVKNHGGWDAQNCPRTCVRAT